MEEFDWMGYAPQLDNIFFKDTDYIRCQSDKYHDFWKFFWRYISFKKKALRKNSESKIKAESHNPSINCEIGDLKEYVSIGKRYGVPKEKVKEFYGVLLRYFDFCQKLSFQKLKKLRTQQGDLPIAQHRDEILKAIHEHQVVIVAGDTGCGKSTQVPQYLLADGFAQIACTQPRRIAAISLSKRVGYETLNQFGSLVAYKIRFDGTKTSQTKILFLTEGLLLRQMQSDNALSQYSVIILDEVHERHLQSDFLLGMFKNVLKQREDLKLILMSATINLKLFQDYFKDAPVIQVPGRLYPIKVKYFPIPLEDSVTSSGNINPQPYVRIMQRIDKKYPVSQHGDLLIFLSGMAEISTVAEAAQRYADETHRWIILCLHSTLSVSDQDKVFDIAPEGTRKCILSTNIAETSVTINGIRFVADSGKVKEMNYDDLYKMQVLKECWISRASAEQRKGRAGRTGPGVCFRMFSEEDYEALIPYTVPEILRLPLANLILQMKSMNIESVREFEFIEPPAKHVIEGYIEVLKAQAALDDREELTPMGYVLSQLPLDIVMGKILVMGTLFDMVDIILSAAAVLSIQSPFTFNAYRNLEATERRKPFESDHGDPFTLLNIFIEWIKIKGDRKVISKKWSKRRCLEEQRFYEAVNLRSQFRQLLETNTLLFKKEEEAPGGSSFERKKQHSDRKNLRKIQAKQRIETRRPKRLKLGAGAGNDSDEDDGRIDIHDIKFNLKNDAQKLASNIADFKSYSHRDLLILKVILCSSLYPQFAIADEHNSYDGVKDLIYHTVSKPFVTLHPTGYFANNTAILDPNGPFLSQDRSVQRTERGLAASNHQLLAYVSLLETKKPYLCNTLRIPALQSLLLFCQSVDISADCRRIICDEWVEFIINDVRQAEAVVFATIRLRRTWNDLLKLKLKSSEISQYPAKLVDRMKLTLSEKLGDFLESKTSYSMHRLTFPQKKMLYEAQDAHGPPEVGPMPKKIMKNGVKLTPYLMYDCVPNPASRIPVKVDSKNKDWQCDECKCSMPASTREKLEHQISCQPGENEYVTEEEESASVSKADKSLHKHFYCDICDKELQLSAVEILKHKRSHR